MGTRSGRRSGCGSVTATWCRTPPAGILIPASAPTSASFGPAGEHHERGADPPGGRLHPGHPAALHHQAGEPDLLAHPDAAEGQGDRVGGDVARRGDVAVVVAEGAAQGLARREGGVGRVHLRRVEPAHRHPQRGLHGQPLPGRGHLGLGEAGKQVALGDEAGVDAKLVTLAKVEAAGPLAQAHRGGRAALHPDHAGGPAARALPEQALLQQHHPVQARAAQEVGTPAADGSAADDHRVGAARMARRGHWHEPDADIN